MLKKQIFIRLTFLLADKFQQLQIFLPLFLIFYWLFRKPAKLLSLTQIVSNVETKHTPIPKPLQR